MFEVPEVRYAETPEGAYIAYAVFGSGPVDLLMQPGTFCPIDLIWDLPQFADLMEALGRLARVIVYDPRGQGASDPLPTTDPAAGLESQASDTFTVAAAAGSERPSILSSMGYAEVAFAGTYPRRVRSLIITNARSSFPEVRDLTAEQRKSIAIWLASRAGLLHYNPRVAHDPTIRRWWAKAHRLTGSPEQVARQMEYTAGLDTSPLWEHVRTPTLVFHRQGNQMWDIETSRKTASKLPNCRFVELPGSENDLFLGDTSQVLSEIARFLGQPDVGSGRENRQLATVLFTDIVASTERLASVGDRAWSRILDDHDRTIDAMVDAHRGRVVKKLGDGILATFDGPARAIRCALAIRDGMGADGVVVRAGLHTGEVELRADDVAGMAVHTGARVAALADAGEVLVSSTVRDLVAGSGIQFVDRGEHRLKGVPGSWRLFAAVD